MAIANAKGANMPKENIERTIKKADKDGSNLQEYTFEGTGHGGAAIFVECLSDNNQRTVSGSKTRIQQIRGELGKKTVLLKLYIRKEKVFWLFPKAISDPEELELELIDGGDWKKWKKTEEGKYVLTVDMKDFGNYAEKT